MEFVENWSGFVERIFCSLLGTLDFFLIEKINEGNYKYKIKYKGDKNDEKIYGHIIKLKVKVKS